MKRYHVWLQVNLNASVAKVLPPVWYYVINTIRTVIWPVTPPILDHLCSGTCAHPHVGGGEGVQFVTQEQYSYSNIMTNDYSLTIISSR